MHRKIDHLGTHLVGLDSGLLGFCGPLFPLHPKQCFTLLHVQKPHLSFPLTTTGEIHKWISLFEHTNSPSFLIQCHIQTETIFLDTVIQVFISSAIRIEHKSYFPGLESKACFCVCCFVLFQSRCNVNMFIDHYLLTTVTLPNTVLQF